MKKIIPEHIDDIEGAEYISALFLCVNDFSIVDACKEKTKKVNRRDVNFMIEVINR